MSAETLNPHGSEGFFEPVEQEHDPQLFHAAVGEVTVHGATCRYKITVPTELNNREITAYLNGLGAFKKTMRGIRNETSSQGDAALTMEPIRRSKRGKKADITDATSLHVDTMEAVFNDLPNNEQLKDIPNGDKLSFSKVNLAPHSYGNDQAVKYALRHPAEVSNIILIKPVGMEDPRRLRFISRLPGFLTQELLPFIKDSGPDFSIWDAWLAAEHAFGNPVLSIGEIYKCMTVDNRCHIPTLRAHKIGMAILTGARDNLIPAGPIEDFATQLVDYYEKLDTDHLGPQREPKKIAAAVIRCTRTLDNQKTVAGNNTYAPLTII